MMSHTQYNFLLLELASGHLRMLIHCSRMTHPYWRRSPREKARALEAKGKGESGGNHVSSSFPPYYQAARTHDRTETEIDFPVGLTPQPSIPTHPLPPII